MSRFRFLPKFLNWQRLVRLTSGAAIIGGSTIAIGTVTTAAVGCHTINSLRPREFTDDYHLNPETLRMPYRHIEFSSLDGVPLRGWWIPATVHGRESKRIVILMHPYNNHKSNLLGVAASLWGHGYSIFMFDFRSFSKEKVRQSIGFLEQNDAVAAINYVLKHYCKYDNNTTSSSHHNSIDNLDNIEEREQIVLMGASMGGVCAVLSSQSELIPQNRISCVVTDCAFSSLNEEIKYRMSKSLMFFPTMLLNPTIKILDIMNKFFYGYSVYDISVSNCVSNENFDRPILIIHSESDSVVPVTHAQTIYDNCHSKNKQLWIIKSSDHCGGFFANPKIFIDYLTKWVENVLDNELDELQSQKENQLNNEKYQNTINEKIIEKDIGNTNDETENNNNNNDNNNSSTYSYISGWFGSTTNNNNDNNGNNNNKDTPTSKDDDFTVDERSEVIVNGTSQKQNIVNRFVKKTKNLSNDDLMNKMKISNAVITNDDKTRRNNNIIINNTRNNNNNNMELQPSGFMTKNEKNSNNNNSIANKNRQINTKNNEKKKNGIFSYFGELFNSDEKE